MSSQRAICPSGIVLSIMLLAPTVRAAVPDVVVSDLLPQFSAQNKVMRYGPLNNVTAYSFGTLACNIGDQPLDWDGQTASHPLIVQNAYRLKDGRIEQIGMAWLKHGFCATQDNFCSDCTAPPNCSIFDCCAQLGVGCADAYSAPLNGDQTRLGPRSDVNPADGTFPFPPTIGWGQTGDALYKRLQIHNDDLDPVLNPNALYFLEGQYIQPNDAPAGNGNNNASYRRTTIAVTTQPSAGYDFLLTTATGTTQVSKPAIIAWQEHGLGANTPDPNVMITTSDVPGDGRFLLGNRVTDLGNGAWHYEYAVQNLNSDRAGRAISIPLPNGAIVTNVGFHDVDYHSGEIFDNTDWSATVQVASLKWESQPFTPPDNANALRFATLYNFWFDCNAPPTDGHVEWTLFKSGSPGSILINTRVPVACLCLADLNADHKINGEDIQIFVAMKLGQVPFDTCADLASPTGPPIDAADDGAFITALLGGAACP